MAIMDGIASKFFARYAYGYESASISTVPTVPVMKNSRAATLKICFTSRNRPNATCWETILETATGSPAIETV